MSKATISKSTEIDQNEQNYAAPDSPVESHVIQRMPIPEEIERRAYELLVAHGAGEGHDLDESG
jgi:hypothetical protein